MGLFPSDNDGTSPLIAFYFFSCASALCISSFMVKRWPLLPEASIVMLCGVVAGGLINGSSSFQVSFSPSLFYCLFLPPLIFKTGLDVDLRGFYQHFLTIMVYANLGTLINTLVVCFLMYGVGALGMATPLSIAETLAFGAIISATDPVTTIAIFDRLHVERHLYVIVVGVSVLDDAISVLIFSLCRPFVTDQEELMRPEDVILAIVLFFLKLLGSMVLGCGLAVGFVYPLSKGYLLLSQHPPVVTTALFVAFVYISYALADSVYLSGIISSMIAAVVSQHYLTLLSKPTLAALRALLDPWAGLFESLLFFYMGLTLFYYVPGSPADWGFVLWSIVVCMVGRLMQIYPLAWLLNWHYEAKALWTNKVSAAQQHMIFLAGLRGPIAFATALMYPEASGRRELVAATSALTVLITTSVLGAATIPSLRWLQIAHHEPSSTHTAPAEDSDATGQEGKVEEYHSPATGWALRIDRRAMRFLLPPASLLHAGSAADGMGYVRVCGLPSPRSDWALVNLAQPERADANDPAEFEQL